jgi:hypothetical protein
MLKYSSKDDKMLHEIMKRIGKEELTEDDFVYVAGERRIRGQVVRFEFRYSDFGFISQLFFHFISSIADADEVFRRYVCTVGRAGDFQMPYRVAGGDFYEDSIARMGDIPEPQG